MQRISSVFTYAPILVVLAIALTQVETQAMMPRERTEEERARSRARDAQQLLQNREIAQAIQRRRRVLQHQNTFETTTTPTLPPDSSTNSTETTVTPLLPPGSRTTVETARISPPRATDRVIQQCGICYEPTDSRNIISLECGHGGNCINCLNNMLVTALSSRSSREIRCTVPACRKKLSIADIRKICTSQNQLAIIQELLTQELLNSESGYSHCPTPNCSYIFIAGGVRHQTTCPSCNGTYCSHCLARHSNTAACNQTPLVDEDVLTRNYLEANTKACPRCRVAIEKNEGCNHINCRNCHHDFWWCCLTDYKVNGVFRPCGSCGRSYFGEERRQQANILPTRPPSRTEREEEPAIVERGAGPLNLRGQEIAEMTALRPPLVWAEPAATTQIAEQREELERARRELNSHSHAIRRALTGPGNPRELQNRIVELEGERLDVTERIQTAERERAIQNRIERDRREQERTEQERIRQIRKRARAEHEAEIARRTEADRAAREAQRIAQQEVERRASQQIIEAIRKELVDKLERIRILNSLLADTEEKRRSLADRTAQLNRIADEQAAQKAELESIRVKQTVEAARLASLAALEQEIRAKEVLEQEKTAVVARQKQETAAQLRGYVAKLASYLHAPASTQGSVPALAPHALSVSEPQSLPTSAPQSFFAQKNNNIIEACLARIEEFIENDYNPLHMASALGDIDEVLKLLAQGSHLESNKANRTAQETGFESKTKDQQATPLHLAAMGGHADIVRALLNQGARVHSETSDGTTPLFFAIRGNHVATIEELLKKIPDIEIVDQLFGHTPLMHAVSYAEAETVRCLLDHDAYIEVRSRHGESLLHAAARRSQDLQDTMEIVKMLLQRGADKNAKSRWGDSPLHIAADSGNAVIVEELICAGADKNIKNKNSETPLQRAEYHCEKSVTYKGEQALNAAKITNVTENESENSDQMFLEVSKNYKRITDLLT